MESDGGVGRWNKTHSYLAWECPFCFDADSWTEGVEFRLFLCLVWIRHFFWCVFPSLRSFSFREHQKVQCLGLTRFCGRILPAGVEIVLQTAKPPDLFRPWKARKYLCSTTTKHWSARRNKWRRNTREAEREIQSSIGNMPWNEKYIKAYLIAVKRSVPRFGETGNFS